MSVWGSVGPWSGAALWLGGGPFAVPGSVSAIASAVLRRAYLSSLWEARRDAALEAAIQAGSLTAASGSIVYIDLTAPTNGTGTFASPRNTLNGYSRPNVATVWFLFKGGVTHQLQDSMLFVTGANLQVNSDATRLNFGVGSYDPATGAQVWRRSEVATLQSAATLTASNPTYTGRPVISVNQNSGKGQTIVSGIRLTNGASTTCYDMVHVTNTDATSTVKLECVYGGTFPNSALQDTNYVSAKAFSVTGNAAIQIKFCDVGDIYGDGIWVSRTATTATTMTVQWFDGRLNGAKQDTAGPDCIQIDRVGTSLVGDITIEDSILHNPRNQKSVVLVSGGTIPSSGETLTARRCLSFGVDVTTTTAAGPENAIQTGWNLNMVGVTLLDCYHEGGSLGFKSLGGVIRGCTVVRQYAGTITPGTNWFYGLAIEGPGTIQECTTLCLDAGGGTGINLPSSNTSGACQSNLVLGPWTSGIADSSAVVPAGNFVNTSDPASVRVDELGRIRAAYLSALAATETTPASPDDWLGNTADTLAQQVVGALQVQAP